MRRPFLSLRHNLPGASAMLAVGIASMTAPMAFAGPGLLTTEGSPTVQAGDATSIKAFDDWQVTCEERSGERRCEVETQGASNGEEGRPAISLGVSYVKAKSNDWLFILNTPLNLLLAKGIEMQVDSGPVMHLAYRSCDMGGCVAPVLPDKRLKRALLQGKNLTLRVTDLHGKSVDVKLSLAGFSAASREAVQQQGSS